jgi:hypothetical protein
MTAKLTADATGTKVTLGTAAEDALQIDATAKTISALAPYGMLPKVPAFAAYQSTEQTLDTSTPKLLYQTEEFDYGNQFDPATSEFTCSIPGLYWFSAGIQASSSPVYVTPMIYKNGVLFKDGADVGNASTRVFANALISLIVGDKIDFRAYSNTSQQSVSGQSKTYASGHLVRAQ